MPPLPAMGNQLGKGRDPGEEKAKVPRNELRAPLHNVHNTHGKKQSCNLTQFAMWGKDLQMQHMQYQQTLHKIQTICTTKS